MEKIILDTGVWGLFFQKPKSKDIQMLMKKLHNNELKLYIIKPVILELSKHLTEKYGKKSVLPLVKSSIVKLNLEILEISSDSYIQAGILQYKYKNFLSSVDSILITVSQKQKKTLYTTDKSAIDCLNKDELRKLKYKKIYF